MLRPEHPTNDPYPNQSPQAHQRPLSQQTLPTVARPEDPINLPSGSPTGVYPRVPGISKILLIGTPGTPSVEVAQIMLQATLHAEVRHRRTPIRIDLLGFFSNPIPVQHLSHYFPPVKYLPTLLMIISTPTPRPSPLVPR
jgi:hypothetical protein